MLQIGRNVTDAQWGALQAKRYVYLAHPITVLFGSDSPRAIVEDEIEVSRVHHVAVEKTG
jgi:hypothetical protein